jgi:beta-galactosidase
LEHFWFVFSIEGPGEIVATDNGDSANLQPFISVSRNTFNGLALVILSSQIGVDGEIKIIFRSIKISSLIKKYNSIN